jgi:hypothetical protein
MENSGEFERCTIEWEMEDSGVAVEHPGASGRAGTVIS